MRVNKEKEKKKSNYTLYSMIYFQKFHLLVNPLELLLNNPTSRKQKFKREMFLLI